MKLRAEANGGSYLLEILPLPAESGTGVSYTLRSLEEEGGEATAGEASVVEVGPGVFSVLHNRRSFLIRLSPAGDGALTVSLGTEQFTVALGDLRDQAPRKKAGGDAGPQELRALMPGKVVKILVAAGETVSAGQGVIIVEAMKMQNEMKAPKDGVVSHVYTSEGSTVAAGHPLLVIE